MPGASQVFGDEFLSSAQQVEDRGLGRSPRDERRAEGLGSTGESKGCHGSCQPASFPRIQVTASNFCLRNSTPTLCAWLKLFKKMQHISRLPDCKVGTIFLKALRPTQRAGEQR